MKELICLLFPLISLGCSVSTPQSDTPPSQTPTMQEVPSTTPAIPDIPVIPVIDPTVNQGSKNSFSIETLTGNGLTIHPLTNIDTLFTGFDLTGSVTDPNIDLIRVKFQNDASNFPNDNYALQTFKKGNTTFLYRAHKQYEVFDNGSNVYTVEGYTNGDMVASIQLIVTVGDPNTPTLPDTPPTQAPTTSETPSTPVPTTTAAPLNEDNSTTVKLPKDDSTYGHPILNNGIVEYSNVPKFTVSQEAIPKNIVCQDAGE